MNRKRRSVFVVTVTVSLERSVILSLVIRKGTQVCGLLLSGTCVRTRRYSLSWNSTGEIGRIGRHRAETRRHFNIRFFGPIPPDASDFPGGIPALVSYLIHRPWINISCRAKWKLHARGPQRWKYLPQQHFWIHPSGYMLHMVKTWGGWNMHPF